MRAKILFFICCIALMSLTLPALAKAERPPQQGQGWHPSVKMQVRSQAKALAEMDDGEGKVGVWSNEATVKISPLTLRYELRSYQWENKHRLPLVANGETPFENLHRLSLGLSHQGPISGAWGWFAGATGTAAFESEIEDSFGGALRAGISYDIDERWQAMVGGTFFANAVRVRAFPILGMVYNGIGKDGTGLMARITAPDASVMYRFRPWFGMSANFGFDSRFYRLADDSAVEPEGFLASRALQASLMAEWSPTQGLQINFGPTFSFAREMSIYRNNGDKVRAPNVDSTLGVACDLSYTF